MVHKVVTLLLFSIDLVQGNLARNEHNSEYSSGEVEEAGDGAQLEKTSSTYKTTDMTLPQTLRNVVSGVKEPTLSTNRSRFPKKKGRKIHEKAFEIAKENDVSKVEETTGSKEVPDMSARKRRKMGARIQENDKFLPDENSPRETEPSQDIQSTVAGDAVHIIRNQNENDVNLSDNGVERSVANDILSAHTAMSSDALFPPGVEYKAPFKEIIQVRSRNSKDAFKETGMKKEKEGQIQEKLQNCFWGRPPVEYPDYEDPNANGNGRANVPPPLRKIMGSFRSFLKDRSSNMKQSVRNLKEIATRTLAEVKKNGGMLKDLLSYVGKNPKAFPPAPTPSPKAE
ncbi:hypothetical protein RUM43_003999 [Polyplax serrata]|uniref:Uncharacterized protein n=1 Tax=Polyplax serrata TaxID=468196 RepID=A0AAN8SAF2_POLSC